MKLIGLKDEYPWYSEESYIEITDEVADVFKKFSRAEQAHRAKLSYHKAYYSLDVHNGTERSIVFVVNTPQELYERKAMYAEIYSAIRRLSEKQAKRIYAKYFLGMTMTQIAKAEGVSVKAVSKSIGTGLKKLRHILENL